MSRAIDPDNAYLPIFGTPISGWYRWFAWRPVDTEDRGWRWLRMVNRRRVQKKYMLPGPDCSWFQYAVTLSAPVQQAS